MDERKALFEAWVTRTNQGYDLAPAQSGKMSTYESNLTEHAYRGFFHGVCEVFAAQPAASKPVVPLEIVAMLNAVTGSNEWQGDHPRTELTEPACRVIAALAAHKAGTTYEACAQIAEQFPFSPNVGRAIAAKIRKANPWLVVRCFGASMSVGIESCSGVPVRKAGDGDGFTTIVEDGDDREIFLTNSPPKDLDIPADAAIAQQRKGEGEGDEHGNG